MASSKSMGTTERNNLLVIEAHSAKDVAQVLVTLGSVWETSVRCASCDVLIKATWAVWDGWALHLLDSANAGENPEVGVGDPWELFCGNS